MPATQHIETSAEFQVSAASLWRTISDFLHIDRWADLKIISTVGNGPGSTRTVEMANGARITERMVQCEAATMTLVYEAVEPNPFPMHDYRSTMVVTALGAEHCRLDWRGDYVLPEGGDAGKTDRLLQKVYAGGIALLREHLEQKPLKE